MGNCESNNNGVCDETRRDGVFCIEIKDANDESKTIILEVRNDTTFLDIK